MGKILSIIIPCYNAEPYINELLNCLAPQITDEVQVIVIDDGSDTPFETSYEWVELIYQENGGASVARNTGIDNAVGEYIGFIDADDLVSDVYVETIIGKIKAENFDFCYLSWQTLSGGWQQTVKLESIDDKFPPFNLCVWNRIYRRSLIGDLRFNTQKKIAEDAEFIRAFNEEGKKKSFISEFMYFYRSTTPNSLTKRFHEGAVNTRRVVYYFPRVTKQMTFLIKEFEELDKVAEIILLTNANDLPQLEKHAMVMRPCSICGTELRGYPTSLFRKIYLPCRTQVVIYTARTFAIGGIETFIYNFCQNMANDYDILVLYETIDIQQLNRLKQIVRVEKNDERRIIDCENLIVNRITDTVPRNIKYKKKIQMVHICKLLNDWKVPQDNDAQICVSEVVAKSFKADLKDDYKVINNFTYPIDHKGVLLLVSATRTSTFEKGQKRMVALSKLFKKKGLPFIWLCFADQPLNNAEEIIYMRPSLNVGEYIKSADYLVQLSDSESFGYSIVEALEMGTPVITTPIDVLSEIGFIDGVTGYTVPFDIDENVDVEKIFNERLKGFEYSYDNVKIKNQWKKVLGNPAPKNQLYVNDEQMLRARALIKYKDIELDRIIEKGEVVEMRSGRVYELMQKQFVEIVL